MERSIDIRLRIGYRPRGFLAVFVFVALLLSTGELGSENLTLTTYYPAPFGAYARVITTDNTTLARDTGRVGIGTGAASPTAKLDTRGNISVYAATSGGERGYIKLNNNNSNCVIQTVVQGTVCGASTFATFQPGIYVEGWSYASRGGQVLAQAGAGSWSTQVWGLNPATGNPQWMTLKKDDSQEHVYCCSR